MKVKNDTVIRTAVMFIALINMLLTLAHKSPLPFSSDQVTAWITGVTTFAATVWTWWKNNSFTKHAIKADEFMKKIKSEA